MKILKRITAIMLATGVLLLSGCDNQTVNSGGSSESSESISDLSSAMTSESGQQTESKDENSSTDAGKNDFSALYSTSIQNITKIDENTLFAHGYENLILADADTCKIIKEIPIKGTSKMQKIDNGFVIIDQEYETCSYDVYDAKGNVIKHVDIPMRALQGEELDMGYSYTEKPIIEPYTLHFSADGKSVVYFGDNGYCINSIDLDNETVIQPVEDFNGGFEEFHKMSRPVLYRDEIVYGTASKFNPEIYNNEWFFASLNLKTKEWTIYYQLNKDQQLFVHSMAFVENSFILVDGHADQRYTEGRLPYLTIGDNEIKEFVCEENIESVTAYISANSKYILTTSTHISDTGKLLGYDIKLYDTETREVLLTKETINIAVAAYIDEDARKIYAQCGEFLVLDF